MKSIQGFNFVSEYITFIDYKSSYVEKVTININKLQDRVY